jgi:hypothetical protein
VRRQDDPKGEHDDEEAHFVWIGRATGTEFIGFYTSAFSTGTFSLSPVK